MSPSIRSIILSLLASPAFSTLVTFESSFSSSALYTQQICSSLLSEDACCIALDLDIDDGRGFGWFRANKISFTDIDAPDAFTAAYAKNNAQVCSGEMVAHQIGQRDWESNFAVRGDFRSGLVVKNLGPPNVQKMWPITILVGSTTYLFKELSGDLFLFRSAERRTVVGRLFGGPVGSNSTGQGLLTNGASANETFIVDQSAE